MLRATVRAAAVALFGAMAGALCLTIAFALQPGLVLEMDREPHVLSGVYPPERVGDLTFAWTGARAEVVLHGADRRVPWVCTVRFRGGRAVPLPQPTVDVSLDGIRATSATASNDYQDLEVVAPPRERDGLLLTLAVSPTVVPGPQDRRELGVQLDRLTCRPGGDEIALPPRRAMLHATLAAAMLGATISLMDLIAVSAVGATLLLAAAQAIPLATGAAPYGAYSGLAVRLALWIGLAVLAGTTLARRRTGSQRLRNTAKFAIAMSAAVLYLQLLALLHPSKTVVDAVFHAHRLEWVLSGRLLFTQPLGSGIQFPYAIGLYVFAAPFSLFTDNHVALLRIVVCAIEIVAGTLLYVMVVRAWGDRLAAAVAVALFSLVPMKYLFIGSANLTNVFGQSLALATMAAVTTLPLRAGHPGQVAAVAVLAAWAFLCHVSTVATLLTILTITAVLYRVFGGPALREPAKRTLAAAVVAALLAVALYYGHFGEVYRNALRLRAQNTATQGVASPPGQPGAGPTKYRSFTPLPVRIRDAVALTVQSVGWPILVLAAAGGWQLWRRRRPDRLVLALMAWTLTYLIFFAAAVMRVDTQYQRYSYEFVGRLTYATYPAAILLAAVGATWAWRAGRVTRVASAILMLAALAMGARSWLTWLA